MGLAFEPKISRPTGLILASLLAAPAYLTIVWVVAGEAGLRLFPTYFLAYFLGYGVLFPVGMECVGQRLHSVPPQWRMPILLGAVFTIALAGSLVIYAILEQARINPRGPLWLWLLSHTVTASLIGGVIAIAIARKEEQRSTLEAVRLHLREEESARQEAVKRASQAESAAFESIGAIREINDSLQRLAGSKKIHNENSNRILSRVGSRIYALELASVLYFKAQDKLILAVTAEGKYAVDRSLNDLEQWLRDRGFFRIHRSTLLNLQHVHDLQLQAGGEALVRLKQDTQEGFAPVSRDRLKDLKRALTSL